MILGIVRVRVEPLELVASLGQRREDPLVIEPVRHLEQRRVAGRRAARL